MTVDSQELPVVLGEIAEAAGYGVALAFASEFGGREIYVPETLSPGHTLEKALGRKGAEAIVRLYGKGRLLVPLGPTANGRRHKERLNRLICEGGSVSGVAAATGAHIRTVYRHKAAIRDAGQGSLFED